MMYSSGNELGSLGYVRSEYGFMPSRRQRPVGPVPRPRPPQLSAVNEAASSQQAPQQAPQQAQSATQLQTEAGKEAIANLLTKLQEKVAGETVGLRERLDAVSLRLSTQEKNTRSLEQSTGALREEFSNIAHVAGGQLNQTVSDAASKIDSLERCFSDFSVRQERTVGSLEEIYASKIDEVLKRLEKLEQAMKDKAASGHSSVPVQARLLRASQGLSVLDRVSLFHPMRRDEAGGAVVMDRQCVMPDGSFTMRPFPVEHDNFGPVVAFEAT